MVFFVRFVLKFNKIRHLFNIQSYSSYCSTTCEVDFFFRMCVFVYPFTNPNPNPIHSLIRSSVHSFSFVDLFVSIGDLISNSLIPN